MAKVLEHSFFTTVSDIMKLTETLDRKAKEDLRSAGGLPGAAHCRPESMVKMLERSFFTTVSGTTKLTETLDRKAKEDKATFPRLEAGQAQLIAGQAQLIDMSSKTIAIIKESTSVIITSIFEATEVFTPTCFVIIAKELPEPAERTEDLDVSTLAKMEDWMESVLELTENSAELVGGPLSATKSLFSAAFEGKVAEMFNRKYVKQQLYLYLVDKHSGLSVFDPTKLCPIKIDVNDTNFVKQHLPLMRVGVQIMALANGVAGIVNMFYPVVPGKVVHNHRFIGTESKQAAYESDKSKRRNNSKHIIA
jgi:hypothetical protein